MRKIIISLLLLCLHFSTRGQTPYEYRYWFDGDISTAVTDSTTSSAWRMEVDLSSLTESFHTIHLQVTDRKGVSSSPATRCFFLSHEGGALTNGYYWFDNEVKVRNVRGDVQGSLTFDVTELEEGFHSLHYQVLREDGLYSQIETRCFYKMQSDQIVGQLTFMCYIDGETFKQERVSVENGAAVWFLDVSELPIGFHKLQVRAIMQNGASTSIREAFFLRNAMDAEVEALSCVFSIDGKPYKTIESGVHEGLFHCDLDVAELSDGLHKIAYMLTNGKGAQTTVKSQYFIKQPVGGNSIKKYQYWLNDNDNMAHTVVQQEVTDPLKLITLLPVEPQPLRSKLFHFETKSGKPMMYAKNEIHLRFYDNSGRWVDASDQYIDYALSQEVKPVGTLQPTQTFNKVASNDVRWYTMQSAPGDTAAFKLSQPATVQVFAPSGAEVFKTSESASVNWSGIHTWENGTYYLAVHDVTGSQSTMKLEYMHMDKYDVVDWDVHRVGNGGCSTITFKGNGFRDLYGVDLVIAPGDTIHSVDVSHDSDAETAVTFDFTAATLGDYNAVFHFTEEDKPVANVVTVEEAVDIELATDVTFPSTFLRGTSTTYTIKITNKGNMTAYDVPIYLYVSSPTDKGINRIDVSGNHVKNLVTSTYSKNLSEGLLDTLKLAEKDWGILYYLRSKRDISEDTGDSAFIRNGYLWKDLKPNEEAVIQVKISASENIHAWFTVPETWETEHIETVPRYGQKKKANNNLSCIQPIINCYYNDIPSWFGPWVVTGVGILKAPPKTMKYSFTSMAKSNNTCVWEYRRSPNCPPVPPNGGGSNSQPPSDPNDIYGYLSEAGSKFIADSVARVNYTIEFENDTTFATAAAHTIVIKDTLDNKVFDLTRFMPTGIRIGSREAFLDAADVVSQNNVTSFVKTIDMRPEINAIAQVDGTFNQKNGIAQWTLQSLDPMTMEPTNDLMQGILPVNYNGTSGIGEVMFEVGVKQGKADGTQIKNRAGIVFDYEEAILTPIWTNIVDAVAPSSFIDEVVHENDSTISFHFFGEDNASGIWKYRFYVQAGQNAPWWEIATDIAPDSAFCYRFYDDIDYGFCVLAVDSAGNVEKKVIQRECRFKAHEGDYEVNVDELPASSTGSTGDSRIYDLSGRRHDELQEGINIIDNKKVLFRRKN